MLIALVGPASAGKLEVAKYLVVHHNFRPAFIASSGTKDGQARRTFDRRWAELVPLCQGQSQANGHADTAEDIYTHEEARLSADGKPLLFDDGQMFLDHVTFHWRDNVVTLDLNTRQDLEIGFDKRPFFLLIGVDAPVLLRWRRSGHRAGKAAPSLDQFVAADDADLYAVQARHAMTGKASPSLPCTPSKAGGQDTAMPAPETPSSIGTSAMHQVVQPNGLLASRSPPSSLRELMQACTLIVHNPFATVAALHTHLASLSLSSSHRLRPSWDTYFLSLCTLASLRSNCMKRRVGAVLVRNNRVLSTGYNGTPRGLRNCAEGGCRRCNGGAAGGTSLDECLCLHAEENALLECGRERGGAEGTVLYCNTCPCLRCAVKIVQTGVREVVYQLAYSMDDRSRQIFREANVLFRQYQPAM